MQYHVFPDFLDLAEAKLIRDAAVNALGALRKPIVESEVQKRIHGFGNYEPPPLASGADSGVGKFVGDSVQEMVDDFREKGPVQITFF